MSRGTEKRVAIVTGGGRGIGRAISTALAQAGVTVAVTYTTRREPAQELAGEIVRNGGTAEVFPMRIEDRGSVKAAMAAVRTRFGDIDILVNNAAMAQEKPFGTITDEEWDRMLAVNLRGAFACSQEALPGMLAQGWGRIINITSIGGQWGGFNQVHYAASKAGLISLTRSLAKIYSKDGVTTNAVAPGLVATEMSGDELQSSAGQEKVRNIPMGRIARPEEVGAVVVFLAGDGAAYVTGQTINVNGGMLFG